MRDFFKKSYEAVKNAIKKFFSDEVLVKAVFCATLLVGIVIGIILH